MNARPDFCTVWKLAAALGLLALSTVPAQSAVESWVRRYSHPANSSDEARKIVTDAAGNVIVVGTTDDNISGKDFLLIKYSGAGVPLWTNRYDGPSSLDDYPAAAAVDGSGNVFVTGYSRGSNGRAEFATLAYSSAGALLWTHHYNGPGSYESAAGAIAVDGSGNVFVTGYSAVNSYDYATVAYSGAGVPLWTNLYNGIGNSYDRASAVAVDDNGNVFVTGASNGARDKDADYLTVAYSGTGVPLWTNRLSGPPGISEDQASAVAVDHAGNVYVTGWAYLSGGYGADYVTVAYSGAGVALWTNLYFAGASGNDWATAMAVDGNGNVFVAGQSAVGNSLYDYATVAYSSSGERLWARRYNGPGNGDDRAWAIAVDGSGTVYVTGSSVGTGALPYPPSGFATIAYSGAGVPLWTNRYNGSSTNSSTAYAVAVDGSGNVFVTGSSVSNENSSDYATVAYSSAGVPLWTNRYSGTGNSGNSATAVAVGASGNLFVTGRSSGDYGTVAYSDAGMPLWTNRYDGPGKGDDVANAVAVDGSGNVFVTGSSIGNGSSYDYATVAYSGIGVPLWTNRYNGPSLADYANAVAVDGSGRVFVTGNSYGTNTFFDYATVAYSGAGVPLWTNRYNGPAEDMASALAVDGSGKVFVTGHSVDGTSSADYLTIAYSAAGAPLWTNRYNGPFNGYDQATAVAADRSGNVFVTGRSTGIDRSDDYATVAYSGAGVPLWTNRYNGPVHSDFANAVAVDGNGNVFVTGGSYGVDNSLYSVDYLTVAYSGTGVPLWTNRYNGPGNGADIARAVAVDGSGNVFVTGQSMGLAGTNDFATVAYSGAGVPLWTNRYNGAANGDDLAPTKSCLAIGPDDSVYVTGASDGNHTTGTTYDYATIKYPSLSPSRLRYQVVGNQLVLSWSDAAFSLQSAPAVHGDYANIPGATSPYSTSFSGSQRFFRLKAN